MAKFQTKAFTGQRPAPLPVDSYAVWVAVDIEMPATAPAALDLIEVVELPIGVKCLDWVLMPADCDSGSALAVSLGTENVGATDLSAEVWGAALTALGTGVPARNVLSVSAQGDILAVRKIALKVTTIATGYTGAGKTAQLLMLLQA